MDVKIHSSWKTVLKHEFSQPYFQSIKEQLVAENKEGLTIYPTGNFIFSAFDSVPFEQVKVVIIGQDPYHGAGQAHGLSFSVLPGVKTPPSLRNMYKELVNDHPGFKTPDHGYLQKWANQGVLLLNAILTVRAKEPASHRKIGWAQFTDATITAISENRENVVFLLWGRFAQQKAELIDESKHLILTAAHPSPFSAHNGFFGCQHFSKTNEHLIKFNKEPIDWQV